MQDTTETVAISRFRIVKAMSLHATGAYTGLE